MQSKLIAVVAISMFAGLVTSAQADDKGHGRNDRSARSERRDHDREHRGHGHRNNDRDRWDRHDSRNDKRHDSRRWDDDRYRHDDRHRYVRHDRYDGRYYDRRVRYHAGVYHRPHGYRHYSWHRGARLPVAYYAPRYIVHDYHDYHLHRPPYGYHWVRVDNDIVLAAIATGVVLQVVDQIFY